MRTTVRIDDELYREVKASAARQGRTVGEVIEDALRMAVASSSDDTEAGEVAPLPTFGGSGVLPGVDLHDSRALREVMDEGESLDAMR